MTSKKKRADCESRLQKPAMALTKIMSLYPLITGKNKLINYVRKALTTIHKYRAKKPTTTNKKKLDKGETNNNSIGVIR